MLLLFGNTVGAQPSTSVEDARALLLDVRKKVVQTVQRLPKYLCTETVDRTTFRPDAPLAGSSCDELAGRRKKSDWRIQKTKSDRLRLDVAVSSTNSEMYSWVGENRFQESSLADLVGGGATSTGAFSSLLGSIFATDDATFSRNQDVSADGRTLVEFGFSVPLDKSNYRFGNKLHSAPVAFDGTFLVDPETAQLVRLTVHAEQLPEDLRTCESTTTLDYGAMRVNDFEFLIPQNTRWQVVNLDGSEFDNHTVFSACHEFHGESSLRFDVEPGNSKQAAEEPARSAFELPPGLSFSLALTSPIDTVTAAAGDSFQAKMTGAIKTKSSGVIVPNGAAVTGRILRIERRYSKESALLTVTVKLETVEVNGVRQPFEGTIQPVVKKRYKPEEVGLVKSEQLGSFDQMSSTPGTGVFRFEDVSDNYVIKRGFLIEGVTAASK
jgi:hypothetical protein